MSKVIAEHNWEKYESHQGLYGKTTVIYECTVCGAAVDFIRDYSPDEKNLRLVRKRLRIPVDCGKAAIKYVMQK